MFDVQIHNDQLLLEIDESLLNQVVRATLQNEGIPAAEISLAIVDDATIHRVNREFLDHDWPTDVVTFRLDSENVSPRSETANPRLEGEIVVSAETATRRAVEFRWSGHDELVLYVVHGLLHLAGYDDRTPDNRRRMREQEIANLKPFHLSPRYDEAPCGRALAATDGKPPGGEPS